MASIEVVAPGRRVHRRLVIAPSGRPHRRKQGADWGVRSRPYA